MSTPVEIKATGSACKLTRPPTSYDPFYAEVHSARKNKLFLAAQGAKTASTKKGAAGAAAGPAGRTRAGRAAADKPRKKGSNKATGESAKKVCNMLAKLHDALCLPLPQPHLSESCAGRIDLAGYGAAMAGL